MIAAWRAACVLAAMAAAGTGAGQEGDGMTLGRELPILAQVDVGGPARALVLRDGAAWVCADYYGLVALDVSDPRAPVVTGRCDTFQAFEVALKGDHAFVADRYGGVQVIAVSDPARPTLVTSYDAIEFATDVEVAGDMLLVPCRSHGAEVVDISDPTAPEHLGTVRLEHFGWQIAEALRQGRYVVVGNGFGVRVIDLEAKGGPALAYAHDTRGALGFSTNRVALIGDLLVATGHRRLRTFDLSDPAHLRPLSDARVGLAPVRLTLGRGVEGPTRAWAACPTSGGVVVADVHADGHIEVVREIETPGHASRVAPAGDRVLVGDG